MQEEFFESRTVQQRSRKVIKPTIVCSNSGKFFTRYQRTQVVHRCVRAIDRREVLEIAERTQVAHWTRAAIDRREALKIGERTQVAHRCESAIDRRKALEIAERTQVALGRAPV